MQFWLWITAFGDSGLMVPMAIAIALWLVSAACYRLSLLWLGLFLMAGMLVTLTKLLFLGWGVGIHALNFTGFSGHTTFAAMVFPVLTRLILHACRPDARSDGYFAGEAFAILVGISRLLVHAHSLSEVVAGLTLGLLLGRVFLAALALTPGLRIMASRNLVLVSLLGLSGLLSLDPAPTQDVLGSVAVWLSGREAPFTRGYLR